MEQNISPVVVPLDAHLEELKERSVLRDELVSESRRLGCGVGGGLASDAIAGRPGCQDGSLSGFNKRTILGMVN
jgi:hypothetical protein